MKTPADRLLEEFQGRDHYRLKPGREEGETHVFSELCSAEGTVIQPDRWRSFRMTPQTKALVEAWQEREGLVST